MKQRPRKILFSAVLPIVVVGTALITAGCIASMFWLAAAGIPAIIISIAFLVIIWKAIERYEPLLNQQPLLADWKYGQAEQKQANRTKFLLLIIFTLIAPIIAGGIALIYAYPAIIVQRAGGVDVLPHYTFIVIIVAALFETILFTLWIANRITKKAPVVRIGPHCGYVNGGYENWGVSPICLQSVELAVKDADTFIVLHTTRDGGEGASGKIKYQNADIRIRVPSDRKQAEAEVANSIALANGAPYLGYIKPEALDTVTVHSLKLTMKSPGTFEALKKGRVQTRLGNTNFINGGIARAGSSFPMDNLKDAQQYSLLLVSIAYEAKLDVEDAEDELGKLAARIPLEYEGQTYEAKVVWITDKLCCFVYGCDVLKGVPLAFYKEGDSLWIGPKPVAGQ